MSNICYLVTHILPVTREKSYPYCIILIALMNKDEKRKEVGRIGEQVACSFLVRKGYTIIDRNYRKPWGEIDVIAEKGNIV